MKKLILYLLTVVLFSTSCSLSGSTPQNTYAWNYPAQIDSGGVTIQIGRVLIADKEDFLAAYNDEFLKMPYFEDKPVLVELIFVIKNNSGQTMSVFPDQGLVAVGGEQVNLFEATLIGSGGDHLGGEILPGITKIGILWFGLRRTPLDAVQSMDIIIKEPFDVNFNPAGPEYHFRLDLAQRQYEDIPEELK